MVWGARLGFAALVGAVVAAWLWARPVPARWVGLFDSRVAREIDVRGGVRAEVEPVDQLAAVRAMAQPGEDVHAEGARVVVDQPGGTDAEALARRFAPPARLGLHAVSQDREFVHFAKPAGIPVDEETWYTEVDRSVPIVVAASRAELEGFVARLPAPPSGLSWGFEHERSRWKAMLLEDAFIDERHIANAELMWDPGTNRPEVRVTFDDAGREIFARESARRVGRKVAIVVDGQVTSSPVIQSAITGGKATITMGGSDPRKAQTEAAALVEALRARGKSTGVRLLSAAIVPPIATSSTLTTARLAAGAVAGLLALLLLIAARVLPIELAPRAPAGRPRPWARLAVTVAAVPVVYGLSLVWAPINVEALKDLLPSTTSRAELISFSVISIGLVPFITAFVLVELVAFLVPPWNRMRLADRAPLARAVSVLGVLLAMMQAYFIAVWMQHLGTAFGGTPVLDPGGVPRLLFILSLTTGSVTLMVLAHLVSRHGLGNGVLVVLGALLLTHVIHGDLPAATPDTLAAVLLLALAAAATAGILALRAGALRLPACGIIPLGATGAALTLLQMVALVAPSVGTRDPMLQQLLAPAAGMAGLGHIALVAGLAVPVTLLIAPARDALRPAVLLPSIAYVAGLAAIFVALQSFTHLPFGAASWALLVATVVDLAGEWRAGKTETVEVTHDLAAADAHAGAYLRGARPRTLLQVFGPFVPIEVRRPVDS